MAGNMKFSHAVGYRGLCSIKPKSDEKATVLLCTGGNINLTQDPIMSGGVWGAGYANAAPSDASNEIEEHQPSPWNPFAPSGSI